MRAMGTVGGYGLADLALSPADTLPDRADDQIALPMLDLMESLQLAADEHAVVPLTTTWERPAPIDGPVDLTSVETVR